MSSSDTFLGRPPNIATHKQGRNKIKLQKICQQIGIKTEHNYSLA